MNLRAARREVSRKSDRAIERETARKWAARAVACYERVAKTTGDEAAKWQFRGDDYRHESLEHAALMLDRGRTVGILEREIDAAVKKLKRKRRRR